MINSKPIPTGEPIVGLSVARHRGSTLVVCLTGDEVWTWSLPTGEWSPRTLAFAHAEDPVWADYPDAENELNSLAALSVGGRLLLAAGGHEQEPAIWDLDNGRVIRRSLAGGAYTADIVALDDAFVTSSVFEEVRLWPPDGTEVLLAEDGGARCLASLRHGDRTLILAGDSGVMVWDAASRAQLADFYSWGGHVDAVAACALPQGTGVFAVTEERELYAWLLETDDPDEPLYGPVPLPEGASEDLVVTCVGGHPLLVIPTRTSLCMLSPADGSSAGHVDTPDHGVLTMQAATVEGRPALVTGDHDGVLRIWDEADLTRDPA